MLVAAPPGGKRPRQAALAPALSVIYSLGQITSSSRLLYVHDDLSGLDFLVDTGATVSLFPHHSPHPPKPSQFCTVDGSPLHTWGRRRFSILLGGRTFLWNFLLAPVDRPILGWDFLVHFKLWIDAPGARLLDSANMTPLCVVSGDSGDAAVVAAVAVPPPVSNLLSQYSDIMGTGFSDIQPSHGVFHHVVTSGPPVHARARLDPVKLASAKAEFMKMEEAGIIRSSCSPWASPLHMVPKPDGSWRPCGDYRALNLATIPDSYPLPYLADFSAQLHGQAVFSKLDLLKGYYQIPMNPADVPKTSVVTPFGAFEWLFMPFGLRNAAQTFQRSMDRLVSDLDFAFVYLDDILVASVDLDQHLVHLRVLLDRLRDNGFKINSDKCLFAQPTVPFLGHSVSVAGVAPLSRHLNTIADFEPPTDIAGLQRFLGLLNFYRRFIPGAAGLLRPLTDALRASARPFTWTAAMDAAFLAAKSALAAACTLQHPVPGAVCPWLLMLPIAMLGLPYNSSLMALGRPWLSSAANFLLLSSITLLLTVNYSLPILPFAISVTCWKAASSPCSLTINPWFMPSAGFLRLLPPVSSAICPTSLSIPLTCSTYPAPPMLLPMPSVALLPFLLWLPMLILLLLNLFVRIVLPCLNLIVLMSAHLVGGGP